MDPKQLTVYVRETVEHHPASLPLRSLFSKGLSAISPCGCFCGRRPGTDKAVDSKIS